jgi:hypothetical protein
MTLSLKRVSTLTFLRGMNGLWNIICIFSQVQTHGMEPPIFLDTHLAAE